MSAPAAPPGPPELTAALGRVLDLVEAAREPWWLIGSAAVALHGAAVSVADVDLLMSAADAERLRDRLGLANQANSGSALFRSEVFFRVETDGLPIEVMGGFERRGPDGWLRVWPGARKALAWGGRVLYAPELAELIEITRSFGRPKDLARVEALSRL